MDHLYISYFDSKIIVLQELIVFKVDNRSPVMHRSMNITYIFPHDLFKIFNFQFSICYEIIICF